MSTELWTELTRDFRTVKTHVSNALKIALASPSEKADAWASEMLRWRPEKQGSEELFLAPLADFANHVREHVDSANVRLITFRNQRPVETSILFDRVGWDFPPSAVVALLSVHRFIHESRKSLKLPNKPRIERISNPYDDKTDALRLKVSHGVYVEASVPHKRGKGKKTSDRPYMLRMYLEDEDGKILRHLEDDKEEIKIKDKYFDYFREDLDPERIYTQILTTDPNASSRFHRMRVPMHPILTKKDVDDRLGNLYSADIESPNSPTNFLKVGETEIISTKRGSLLQIIFEEEEVNYYKRASNRKRQLEAAIENDLLATILNSSIEKPISLIGENSILKRAHDAQIFTEVEMKAANPLLDVPYLFLPDDVRKTTLKILKGGRVVYDYAMSLYNFGGEVENIFEIFEEIRNQKFKIKYFVEKSDSIPPKIKVSFWLLEERNVNTD